MAGEATVQAAIQTLLQATTLYDVADVTLGDSRVIGRGRQCAIIYPGPFRSVRGGDYGQVIFYWTHYVDIWRPFPGDDYATIVADRQTVVDTINANPTLAAAGNFSDALAESGRDVQYLWPRNASGATAKPSHVGFRIEVRTVEEVNYSGSGQFS